MADSINDSLLHEVLTLQKESTQANSRIESKMDGLDTRMKFIEAHSESQDVQLSKLTELLSEQRNINSSIEKLTKLVDQHTEQIIALQNKDAKLALSIWKKILSIILTVVITAAAGWFVATIKDTVHNQAKSEQTTELPK